MPLPSVSPWGLCSEQFPQMRPTKEGWIQNAYLPRAVGAGAVRELASPDQVEAWEGAPRKSGGARHGDASLAPGASKDRQFWKAGGTYSRGRCCGPRAGRLGAPCGYTVFFPGRALSASTEPGTQECDES